jgi:hypothetical protein
VSERIGRALPAVVAVAAVFALAIGDGGRHVGTMVWAQSAVLIALAIAIATGATRDLRPAAPLLVMIGVVALTSIPSIWPSGSVRDLVLWVTYAAIAMLVATGLEDAREWFVDGVVLTAGWLCLVALFWFWGSGDISARWSSTFYWPNPFAAFLLLVVPLTLVRAVRAASARNALAHGAATVLLTVSLVFTYSRGAWAAGLLALVATAMVMRPPRRRAAMRAGVIALVVVACVWVMGRSASSGTTGAVAARAASISDAGDASAHGQLPVLDRRPPDLPRPPDPGHRAEHVRRHLRVLSARGELLRPRRAQPLPPDRLGHGCRRRARIGGAARLGSTRMVAHVAPSERRARVHVDRGRGHGACSRS